MHACRRELSFVKHSVWPTIIFEILQVAGQVPAAWPLPFAFLPRLLSASVSSFVQDWITAPIVRLLLESGELYVIIAVEYLSAYHFFREQVPIIFTK